MLPLVDPWIGGRRRARSLNNNESEGSAVDRLISMGGDRRMDMIGRSSGCWFVLAAAEAAQGSLSRSGYVRDASKSPRELASNKSSSIPREKNWNAESQELIAEDMRDGDLVSTLP